jgi:hypothetical protein
MRHAVNPHLWRQNFIAALHLIGKVAARLPVGVPDPVLRGTAAVELYTGGLWVAPSLVVKTPAPRVLAAELFAAGFRLHQYHHASGTSLWHADLKLAIDLIEHKPRAGSAAATNAIRVAVDDLAESDRGEPVSIKVIGLEDLIVKEAVWCLTRDRLLGEAVARIRMLVELGCAGVGGGFRAEYLEWRLAWETEGEVVFDCPARGDGSEYAAARRTMTLGEMQHVISTWRTRRGFCLDDAVSRTTRWVGSAKPLVYPAKMPRRAEGSFGGSAEVIPLNVALATLHHQD